MPDNGLFDLRQFFPYRVVPPEKRQRRGIVAKQQHALLRFQGNEGPANLRQMRLAQSRPIISFVGQCLGEIHRERQE